MKRSRLIGLGLAALAVGFVGWRGYNSVYAAPRAELLDQLDQLNRSTEFMEGELAKRVREKRLLESLAVGLVGGSRDQAEHTLRESTSELGSRAELDGVLVTTGALRQSGSPYLAVRRGTSSSMRRLLRDRVDFGVMSATLTGEGSWEQVLGALALLESQPWVARRPAVRIEPVNDARTRFALRATIEAFHAADLAEPVVPEVVGPTETAAAFATELAGIDLFRVPPPPPPPPPVVEEKEEPKVVEKPKPKPPPPPPYDRWRLTAVIEGSRGVAVVMTNLDGRGSRTLEVGAGLLGGRFLGASGEVAEFEIEGVVCEVRLGMTLAQRSPKDG